MKVYIVGPMRGYPDWNFKAFDDAAKRWREAGHHPMNPAQTTRALGYLPSEQHCTDDHLRHVMRTDIDCIFAADALALLPNWERSVGGTLEVALGQWLGLRFYDAITMKEISIPTCPWQVRDNDADLLEDI